MEKEAVERRFKESKLGAACERVAIKLGEDRDSVKGECYTQTNYLYQDLDSGLEIDCNLHGNLYGNGRLIVKKEGKVVLAFFNDNTPKFEDDTLPLVEAGYGNHRVTVFEPGTWEEEILDLDK